MVIESEEDEELLNADNYCYACGKEENHNVLLVCDKCVRKCCHIYCLNPPLEFIPEDEWYCDYCVVNGNMIHSNPIAGIRVTSRRDVFFEIARNVENNIRGNRRRNQI